MFVSAELLDALKAAQGNVSDYRIAQILGVKQQTVSCYRRGLAQLSSEKVVLICEMAGLNAGHWLLRMQLERAKCDSEKAIWNDLLYRLAA